MQTYTKLTAVVLTLALTACGTIHDRRDAPWDPPAGSGRTLLDQIPNWDNAAEQICCGRSRVCKPHQSPRC